MLGTGRAGVTSWALEWSRDGLWDWFGVLCTGWAGNILGILACLSVKGSGGVTLPGRGTRGSALGGEQPKDDLGGLQPQ